MSDLISNMHEQIIFIFVIIINIIIVIIIICIIILIITIIKLSAKYLILFCYN